MLVGLFFLSISISLAKVRLFQPNLALAYSFYIDALGLTIDPFKYSYQTRNSSTIWANIGIQQIHLPPGDVSQVVNGHIGLLMPDLEALRGRLQSVKDENLLKSKFKFNILDSRDSKGIYVPPDYNYDIIEAICPYGNVFRIYQAYPGFGMASGLGILYVSIECAPNSSEIIAKYYNDTFDADIEVDKEYKLSRVICGDWQQLILVEIDHPRHFDGYHVAFYVNRFSKSYNNAKASKTLLLEHKFNDKADTLELAEKHCQFRTSGVFDGSNAVIHEIEHEIRSLRHPLYHRALLNAFPTVPPTYIVSKDLNKYKKDEIDIRKAVDSDAAEICRIYNEGILSRLATLETVLRTPQERLEWLKSKSIRHPVFVAELKSRPEGDNSLLGWVSLNQFNARAAYDHVADFSLYIGENARGKGIGKILLNHIVQIAADIGFHKLVLAAHANNANGHTLYKQCGFREVGYYVENGFLCGKGVDILLMEKVLHGPHKH